MTHASTLAGFLAVLAIGFGGASCALLPPEAGGEGAVDTTGLAYPAGCAAFDLSPARCEAIVDAQAAQLGIDRSTVVGITLLGDPGCGEGPNVICSRTTTFIVRVRFVTDDAKAVEGSQFCGIDGQFSPLCTESPEIRLSSPTMNGYGDIPCSGDDASTCASPVPTADPGSVAEAAALRVAALDIPLDHVGQYEIPLGTATLPNGILTEATFAVADPHQAGFTLTDGVVALAVIGEDGAPMWNRYEHGWREGVETVDVRLVFEVASLDGASTLSIRDVVVH